MRSRTVCPRSSKSTGPADRTLTYLDADQQRRFERIELRDRTGKLLQTWSGTTSAASS
jgi:hypothetical protein